MKLTAKRVTDALRKCSGTKVCDGCHYQYLETPHCMQQMQKDAAAVIDAMMLKWIPGTERKPDAELAAGRERLDLEEIKVIVQIDNAQLATVLFYDGDGSFYDQNGIPYNVTKWMPMPGI